MKTKLLMLLCLFSTFLFAQKNVAVYVTGDEHISSGVKKVFGSELVAAIVKNNDYKAVERTSEFLNAIQREQGYQHSGNVEDSQISALGKQFGVEYVCVAEITDFTTPSMGQALVEYYVQARLIDVEKATIVATAREILQMSGTFSSVDIVKPAENLANKLIGKGSLPIGNEYSTYLNKKADGCTILKIDNTGVDTKVTYAYQSLINGTIHIKPTTYIVDKETNVRYMLLSADGIGVYPQSTNIYKNTRTTFTLHFKKMPSSTSNVDIIEPDGWGFYGISLKPYGQKDYFLFADNSSALQQEAKTVKAQNTADILNGISAALNQATEDITKTIEENNVYELTIMNTHSSPRNIYIEGKFIGKVPGYGSATFNLSTNVFGKVESVQASGYIFTPNREFGRVDRPYKGKKVLLRF